MRRLFGGAALALVVVVYLVYDMRLFDGVAWTALWPFSLLDTSQLVPRGSGAFAEPAHPAPAPLPDLLTPLLRGENGEKQDAVSNGATEAGSSRMKEQRIGGAGERNEQLARWFAVASRAAGDASETDCKGTTAAEWSPGCTLGKRGRWFAGRA